ncbi:MAG: hypothetical protein JWM04_1834 [Verrucomicrobiales bacterium]|nr:hypothetical protein [Verrucomicrobiales bacterium]
MISTNANSVPFLVKVENLFLKTMSPGSSFIIRNEGLTVFGLICLQLLLNLVLAERFALPWGDEILYTDPSVNFIRHDGFSSMSWWSQPKEAFWAANVPLHQFLLVGWLTILPFGVTSVRALNFVLLAATVFVIWRTVRSRSLCKSAPLRVCMVTLLLTGAGVTFSIRTGRPDAITMLVAALVFACVQIEERRRQMLGLIILGALSTWAGLQLCAFLGILGALLTFLNPGRFFKPTFRYSTGCMLGALILFLLYNRFGVLYYFLRETFASNHMFTGDVMRTVSGPETAKFRSQLVSRILPSLSQLNTIYLIDRSYVAVLGTMLIGFTMELFATKRISRISMVGTLAGLTIPWAMFVVGKYPIYYHWMLYLVVVVCMIITFSRLIEVRQQGSLIIVCIASLIAIGTGWPLSVCEAIKNWESRSQSRIETVLAPYVHETDVACTDSAAWFAAKKKCRTTFYYLYSGSTLFPDWTRKEKESVTVIIVDPENRKKIHDFPGNWKVVASENHSNVNFFPYAPHFFNIEVYRKAGN